MDFMDIFNDDAFSLTSLTAAISNMEHVPGRAGELAFAGVGEGVNTLSVAIERVGMRLSLIRTSARGAPAPKETQNKATLRSVTIPQIKLEDTIGAHQIQGVRAFGSTNELRGVQTVVNNQMRKMTLRHDLTLEFHRLGALKGVILDSDASTLTDLFALFEVHNDNSDTGNGAALVLDANGNYVSGGQMAPKIFDFDLDSLESEVVDLRIKCQEVTRFMARNAQMVIPSTAKYWALAGDRFFDKLISRPDVKEVYKTTLDQERRLGNNYTFGAFEFGGIVWENYRGTDDNSTVAIATDEARLFLTGVPGLYAEYYAPADFMDTVNTVGLPRYARLAPDHRFNQYVELHTQQNPLPLCLRPQTLCKII